MCVNPWLIFEFLTYIFSFRNGSCRQFWKIEMFSSSLLLLLSLLHIAAAAEDGKTGELSI